MRIASRLALLLALAPTVALAQATRDECLVMTSQGLTNIQRQGEMATLNWRVTFNNVCPQSAPITVEMWALDGRNQAIAYDSRSVNAPTGAFEVRGAMQAPTAQANIVSSTIIRFGPQ